MFITSPPSCGKETLNCVWGEPVSHQPCWVARHNPVCGNVLRYDRVARDNSSCVDSDSGEYDRTTCQPHVVLDDYVAFRLGVTWDAASCFVERRERVGSNPIGAMFPPQEDCDATCNGAIVSYGQTSAFSPRANDGATVASLPHLRKRAVLNGLNPTSQSCQYFASCSTERSPIDHAKALAQVKCCCNALVLPWADASLYGAWLLDEVNPRYRVEVLLSTFNGQEYVADLVRSILRAPAECELQIRIRDDGSTDETLEVLRDLINDTRIVVEEGENLGPTRSFFSLLDSSSPHADFVAFADQDDIWLPGKVDQAVRLLAEKTQATPALYCSRATVVSATLCPIGMTRLPRQPPSVRNALVENIATGFTTVLNAAARDALVRHGWPQVQISHDRWCYLVVAALGTVYYDPRSFALYRQHVQNAIGVDPSPWRAMVRRIRRVVRGSNFPLYSAQAREFERLYAASLADEALRDVRRLAHATDFRSRVAFAVAPGRYRQRLLDEALLRLGAMTGAL